MSKTLVEQLREMVENSIESNRYPTMYVDGFIGHEVETTGDERELFTAIADRIESGYMELPMIEGEPLKVGDRVDGYNQVGAEVVAIMNSEMIVVRSTVKGGKGYHDEAYPLLLWSVGDLKRHQPDTLDSIEEDAFMDSIIYCNKYGLIDSRCNAEEGDEAVRHCVDCGLSCETRMVKHLLRRQREVFYGVMHLADLIDPEPERTCRYEHIEGTWYKTSCGERYDGVVPPNYCPNCGAEVVS